MGNLLSILVVAFKEGVFETLAYAGVGIALCVVSYFIIDFLVPGKLGKQIAEDKNVAIAILAGSMILGICIIIAAAISG